MVVEFTKVVVFFIVQSGKDAAARQLRQIPGGQVFSGRPAPLAGAVLVSGRGLVFLPERVEVRVKEELLTGQSLRGVHPQTALH